MMHPSAWSFFGRFVDRCNPGHRDYITCWFSYYILCSFDSDTVVLPLFPQRRLPVVPSVAVPSALSVGRESDLPHRPESQRKFRKRRENSLDAMVKEQRPKFSIEGRQGKPLRRSRLSVGGDVGERWTGDAYASEFGKYAEEGCDVL